MLVKLRLAHNGKIINKIKIKKYKKLIIIIIIKKVCISTFHA
jgi:hypothetical protein